MITNKLRKIARAYRINLDEPRQPDAPSITRRMDFTDKPVSPVATTLSPEAELARLTNEFQQARQRLNDFLVRQKAQRRAARLAR